MLRHVDDVGDPRSPGPTPRIQLLSQAAEVPSSKVTDKVPRSPAKNSRMVAALVSRMDSITNLPVESFTATEMVA